MFCSTYIGSMAIIVSMLAVVGSIASISLTLNCVLLILLMKKLRNNKSSMCNVPINAIPHSPTPGLDAWGNSGDLTEYHVKNSSPGASPDVNTPIHRQESIGD